MYRADKVYSSLGEGWAAANQLLAGMLLEQNTAAFTEAQLMEALDDLKEKGDFTPTGIVQRFTYVQTWGWCIIWCLLVVELVCHAWIL